MQCNIIHLLPTIAMNIFPAENFLVSLYIGPNSQYDYSPSSSLVPQQFLVLLQRMTLKTLEGPQISIQLRFHLSLNHK